MDQPKLLLFLLVAVFPLRVDCGWVYDQKPTLCGTFFSETNYKGFNKTIGKDQIMSDLSSLTLSGAPLKQYVSSGQGNITWNDNIHSLDIIDGCKLRVCSDAHLNGVCENLEGSIRSVSNVLRDISSVGCGCPPPDCDTTTCRDVKFRDSECGRAFFEPHCRTCKTREFLTIREHTMASVGKYMQKVKSIHIKTGCDFFAYNEENFMSNDGTVKILKSDYISDDIDFDISSYTCECSSATKQKSFQMRQQKDPNDPPLIDIPEESTELIELAKRFPNHIGVNAAITSLRNERSPKNAYIIVVGLTGSGKSTSINLLFDTNVTVSGGTQSTTSAIHEYRIPVQVDELGCRNCELRVIDTPGFGDTGGIDVDAKFLAGLDEYLRTHEELSKRRPNVVLIFASFSDNRIEGPSSSFVKMLRGTELFSQKLIDQKFSNVVTVLTHFMAVSKNLRKNPADKLKKFRQLIQDHTTSPQPIRIVVAENKPDDSSLPMINGYYKLPNNEYYPKNLFEEIQDATGGRDPIGEAIIRNAFKRPEDFNITEQVFWLDNTTLRREAYYLGVLTDALFNVTSTEVSKLMDGVYLQEISQDLKAKHSGSFDYIKKAFNLRKIFTLADIPRTTLEITTLFKNIRHNSLIEEVLQKAFDLRIPVFEQRLVVGQGFNILKNAILVESPFDLNDDFASSSIGFKLPGVISCTLVNHEQKNIYSMDNNRQEYLNKRINAFNFNGNIRAQLTGDLLPGYNTLEDFNQTRELTAVREFHLFQLTLKNMPKVTQTFLQVVDSLPALDESDNEIVEKWKAFFEKYGTHVVRSAFGGGAVEGIFKSLDSSTSYQTYTTSIQEVFNFLEDISLRKPLTAAGLNITVPYSIRFHGGDFRFHTIELSKLTTVEATKTIDKFEDSLIYKPTILTSDIELLPISEIVKRLSPAGEVKIKHAAQALLNANLTYYPPPPEVSPLQRADVIKHLKTINEPLVKLVDYLTSELANITKENQKLAQQLIEQNLKQGEIHLKKIANEVADTKRIMGLTCIYPELDLKGKKVCVTNVTGCMGFNMGNAQPKSINTHNACVRIYASDSCYDTYHNFTSNETLNTEFPVTIPHRQQFSMIRCEYGRESTRTMIVVILDESGSMYSTTADVIQGYNSFLQEQKALKADKARLTLIKFATGVTHVHSILDLSSAPALNTYSYKPDGWTALYDAITEGINYSSRTRLSDERVLVLIVTDGGDNNSKYSTASSVQNLIATHEALGKWTFGYIGVNRAWWATTMKQSISNTDDFNQSQDYNFRTATNAATRFRKTHQPQMLQGLIHA